MGGIARSLAPAVNLWHKAGMNAGELRKLVANARTRPFTIYAEGKAFRVAHPEFAALSPDGGTLIVFDKQGGAFDVLDVPLIARIAVRGKAAAPK